MKRIFQVSLTLAVALLVLTSCNCFKKVSKKVDLLETTTTPTVLSLKGDQVPVTYEVNFPAKFVGKKSIIKITPVLAYEGGEIEGDVVYVQGTSVKENYTVISTDGGKATFSTSFPYKDAAKVSVMELRLSLKCKANKTVFLPLAVLEVAPGVSTVQNMAYDAQKATFGKDNFERVTHIGKDANIMFKINSAALSKAQLNNEEVKALEDFIAANTGVDRRTVGDLYTKAYASPDGPLAFNDKLSEQRKDITKKELSKKIQKNKAIAGTKLDFDALGEDWSGFKKLVEESNIADKDLILQVLAMYDDPVKRDEEIKNMTSVFTILAEKILPQLRRSALSVDVAVEGRTDDELKAALESDPSVLSEEELLYVATLYTDNTMKSKAYTAAVEAYPQSWRAWNNLAAVYAQEGDIDAAQKAVKKAASINPTAPEVVNNMGVIALESGDVAAASQYFSSLSTPEATYNQGLVALAKGDYNAAAATLDGYNKAVALVLAGNLSAAKAELAKVKCDCALPLKAVIAAREGNFAEANALVAQAEKAGVENVDIAKSEITMYSAE